MKSFLFSFLALFIFGCSAQEPGPQVDPRWSAYLDPKEQWDFAKLTFYGQIGTDDDIRYAEYQYRVGYISKVPVTKEESRELARLEIAVLAAGDTALREPLRLRYFELRNFYYKYSDLSRDESKELALLELKSGCEQLPVNASSRFRDLFYRADNGLITAE